MGYFKRSRSLSRPMPRRFAMSGLGDFTDTDQCSSIPPGDPYRKPGNYCATPDGGTTTFNSDGTTYWAPGAVNPDPANLHSLTSPTSSTSTSSSSSSGGVTGLLSSIAKAFGTGISQQPVVVAPSSGMSTTTMIALAGGAVLVAVLLARR
jgi:hypothetical protein